MAVLPTIGAFIAAVAIGWFVGWFAPGLRLAFLIHAEARDLMAQHGDGAAAEVETRIARALWRCDQHEAECWRRVGQVIERLSVTDQGR